MSRGVNSGQVLRIAEWLLAIVGVVNCVVVPFLFAQNQSDLFPLPGLYFIEIALSGVLGLISVVIEHHEDWRWRTVPWIVAGILLAFVVLGGFSIGFFLIPATIAFLGVGFLGDRHRSRRMVSHVGHFLIAAAVQATIMLIAITFS